MPAASSPARTRGEVLGARLTEPVGDRGRRQHEVLVTVDLAVEDAQRVLRERAAGSPRRAGPEGLEVRDEFLAVGGPARVVADRVQLQAVAAQASITQVPLPQLDDLDVGARRLGADHLDAELAELAHAPGLGRPWRNSLAM